MDSSKERQMKRMQKLWLAAAAGLVLASIASVGAVYAQQGSTGTTGTTFLERVAQKLGINSDTVRQAARDASSDEIDVRLAAGEITQAQADAMKAQLAT